MQNLAQPGNYITKIYKRSKFRDSTWVLKYAYHVSALRRDFKVPKANDTAEIVIEARKEIIISEDQYHVCIV